MARARKITIGNLNFDKVGDATAFFKKMLNGYSVGNRVSNADAVHLERLVDRHDERDEKIGCGINGFEVNTPPDDVPQFSGRCFWLIRNDGTKIDISYKHCLEKKPND